MIRVPLTVIVFLYLFVFLSMITAGWVLDTLRRRRQVRRALQFRLRCAICGFEFEDRNPTPLPNCPRCGRRNERVSYDPL